MTDIVFVYLSATLSFVFLCLGVVAGWTINDKYHENMYEVQEESIHPEMLNSNGQWINEELLSVRFVDLEEEETEEE